MGDRVGEEETRYRVGYESPRKDKKGNIVGKRTQQQYVSLADAKRRGGWKPGDDPTPFFKKILAITNSATEEQINIVAFWPASEIPWHKR